MTNEICGCFQTKEEAVRAINTLSLKGYPADRIKVFTTQTDPKDLAKETDGSIVHVNEDVPNRPASRFKNLFYKVSGCDMNIHDRLRDEGLSERQAEKYTNHIRSGNIFVLADNKLKMGHNQAVEEFSTEVPLVNHHNH